MNTKELISALKRQRGLKSKSRFADLLGQLVVAEPHRWLRLLFVSGFIPEPYFKNANFHSGCAFLSETVEYGFQQGIISDTACQELLTILESAQAIRKRLEDIVLKLREIPFTKESVATQLYYFGAVLENQNENLMKHAAQRASQRGAIDFAGGITADIPSSEGNPNYSVSGLYEATVLAIELAIRNLLHQNTKMPSRLELNLQLEWHSQSLNVLMLAGSWTELERVWEGVRYSDWRPQERDDRQIVFGPSDVRIVEVETNRTREIRYIEGLTFHALVYGKEHLTHIQRAAASIRVGPRTLIWNGEINITALRKARKWSDFLYMADDVIAARFLQPLIGKITIDCSPSKAHAGWNEWLDVINFVRDLSHAMAMAFTMARSPVTEETWIPPIFVARIEDLSRVCSAVTGLSEPVCQILLRELVFNPKRQKLDPWDQPLLPVAEGQVMIFPSLVTGSHPRSLIEDFLLQAYGEDVFDLRNTPFEQRVAQIMERGSGAIAAVGAEFLASDKKSVEYDVVVWWDGYLILLEVKSQRSAFDDAGYYRVRERVEEAIEQVVRRRRLLSTDWNKFRQAVKNKNGKLNLPTNPPAVDKVIGIAVVNSFRYTSMQQDGVVVTDDICLNRFFDDPRIPLTDMQGDVTIEVEAGRIRESEEATPEELFAYLTNPLQISLLRQDITLSTYTLRPIGDEPLIAYRTGRYEGDSVKMLATLTPSNETFFKELQDLRDAVTDSIG